MVCLYAGVDLHSTHTHCALTWVNGIYGMWLKCFELLEQQQQEQQKQ